MNINWNNGFVLDLESPHNEKRNKIIEGIVDKYKQKARMGKDTLILFCVAMFCAGAEYQQHIINAELSIECPCMIIGNWFITSMDKAFKEADIVAFVDDLKLLLEVGKDCFNSGIRYANADFNDTVKEISDITRFIQ